MYLNFDNSRICSNPTCMLSRNTNVVEAEANIKQLPLPEQLAHFLKSKENRENILYAKIVQSKGFEVQTSSGELFRYQLSLTSAIGDIPAIAEISDHHSHTNYTDICGTHCRGIYFPHIDEHEEPHTYSIKQIADYKSLESGNGEAHCGIKRISPFVLSDSFHEQNIEKQIGLLANDGGKKYGRNNPFFLRKQYCDKISLSFLEAKDVSPRDYLNGELIDAPHKSGFARAVDIIDFFLYIVPTREATNDVCSALKAISRACHISQKYALTNSDLQDYQKALMTHIGTKSFTISEYLLLHLSMAARTLDPPRYLSVRPLERMNGKLTQQINSRSQPGENAANIVQTHYADTYNRVHHPLGNTNSGVIVTALPLSASGSTRIINTEDIFGYAIIVPSILESGSFYVSWESC
ncbi:hypothetical protein AB4K20DRAFT_1989618 [Rhizopus microsporus]|uniref:Uncharacterized protein n=1 Tax=Rhizopus microsporus TaxID=58291 RepID=A0A1X0SES4_RHIZD|nr:hypothetical protein BCV71DRAFT_284136 [Rhizopus microsporus]